MAHRRDVTRAFDELLQPAIFKDYGPNGLQVEGREDIGLIVSGVTASLALIEAAVARGADAIFVHHGLFWRGHDGRITGWLRRRLGLLMANEINLYAYHLPLDAHPRYGNNARLGEILGFGDCAGFGRFGEQQLGFIAQCPATSAGEVVDRIGQVLARPVTAVAGDGRPIRNVAWCTGGAQGYFESAIAAGADMFITGEISEPQAHYARETGVAFVACGHHASERYGAPAAAGHVAAQVGARHEFVDIDNPA